MRRIANFLVPLLVAVAIGGAFTYLRPVPAASLVNEAVRKFEQGANQEALALLDRAVKTDPKMAQAWHNRGIIRTAQGEWEQAAADYSRAIELGDFPKLDEAYASRAASRHLLGDVPGAMADYDAALRVNPRCTLAFVNRSNSRGMLGDFPGAIADATEAIRLEPGYAEAWFNRGQARQLAGDVAGAETDFRKALRLKPILGEKLDRARKLAEPPEEKKAL